MKNEGKSKTLLFFVFLVIPSYALFILSGSKSLTDYITTTFYEILTVACLVVLGTLMKSDDKYYRNLTGSNLVSAILLGLVMTALSWGLSLSWKDPKMLLSVNNMGITGLPSSIITLFLSLAIYGLVMAATSEELFKLTMFAEGKKRWGNGYKIGAITLPGALIYIGFPIGFWAALHGIQAYSDPVMIIPAAVNGIFLIIYLAKTRCFLGCVFAHFVYNFFILSISFINGTADIPAGTPFLPNIFDGNYYSNSGFIFDFLLISLFCGSILFFLLPSLTRDKRKR